MLGISGLGGSLSSTLLQRLQNRPPKPTPEDPANPVTAKDKAAAAQSSPAVAQDDEANIKALAEQLTALSDQSPDMTEEDIGAILDQLV